MKKVRSLQANAVLNGLRHICSVIFPLITIPYVSRILGAENYGKVHFGSSFVSYFSLIAAFGVSTYAIREGARVRNKPEELKQFADQVFTINIITTFISYILLAFFLLFWHKVQGYRTLIIIQSSVILFTTLGINWINNVYEDFLYTTVRYVVVQFLSLIPLFLLVRKQEDYLLYAGIVAFANIAGNVINIFYIRKNYIKVSMTLYFNIKKHITPMLFIFGNVVAATIYVSSDTTILNVIKGDLATGWYSLSANIYTAVKLLANAVVSVAIPRASVYLGNGNTEQFSKLLKTTLHAIIVVVLPCVVGIFMLSDEIILLIGGSEYLNGSNALKLLSIALMFAVVSYYYVYLILIPQKREKYCMLMTLTSALTNIILNLIIIPIWSLSGAAFTTLISEVIVVCMGIYYQKRILKLKIDPVRITPSIVGSFIIAILCLVIKRFVNNYIICIVICILASVVVYGVVLLILRDEYARVMLSKLSRKNRYEE